MHSRLPEQRLSDVFPGDKNPQLNPWITKIDRLKLPFEDKMTLLSALTWEQYGSFDEAARLLASTPKEISQRLDILYHNDKLLSLYDEVDKEGADQNGQNPPKDQKQNLDPITAGAKKKPPMAIKIPTINRIIAYLVREQSGFIQSLDPALHRDISFAAIGSALGVHPTTVFRQLNRIDTINIQGKEIPVKRLLGHAVPIKSKLQDLLRNNPQMTDREASVLLSGCFGFSISRRTVAKYRLDLGIEHSKKRGDTN